MRSIRARASASVPAKRARNIGGLYPREGERFPCPADILRLLPRCRAEARAEREDTALPEMTVSAPDAVRERARAISRGARSGTAAQRMSELLGRVLVMPSAGPEVRQ